MTSVFMADVVVAQGLTPQSGTQLQNLVLPFIGSIFILFLAGRALGALLDERFGKMLSLFAAAIPVAGVVFLPEQSIEVLKGCYTFVLGG